MISKSSVVDLIAARINHWRAGKDWYELTANQMAGCLFGRELDSMLADIPPIDIQSLPEFIAALEEGIASVQLGRPYMPLSIADVERAHVMDTLVYTKWNKSQAAHILEIERSTLDRKLAQWGVKRPSVEPPVAMDIGDVVERGQEISEHLESSTAGPS